MTTPGASATKTCVTLEPSRIEEKGTGKSKVRTEWMAKLVVIVVGAAREVTAPRMLVKVMEAVKDA
jgi:hypothetical protein